MFGRRKPARPDPGADPAASGAQDPAPGPYDAADVDPSEPGSHRVDLGSLLVPPVEGVELQLRADQASGTVTGVLLAGPDAAVELQVFAAPKSGGLWADVRREIGGEATRLGGTVDERDGAYGSELLVRVPVRTQDGRAGSRLSRVVGFEGPRWLLRATFLGAAAEMADPDGALERAVRDVVVVRGSGPMSPREQLPLRLPPGARGEAAGSVDAAPPADGPAPG